MYLYVLKILTILDFSNINAMLTRTSLLKRFIERQRAIRASPQRRTSWLLRRGRVRKIFLLDKTVHPIVFLKSVVMTRGSERARSEAKAVHWSILEWNIRSD